MNPKRAVDDWLDACDNPMKPVVSAMREVIRGCDAGIGEDKWQAQIFVCKGNVASFFPEAKKHASPMFHERAEIPGETAGRRGHSM